VFLKLQSVSLASFPPSLFENLELQLFAELSSVRGVVSRNGSSADQSNVLRSMCVSHRTGVDIYCTSQSQILVYVLEYMTEIRLFTVYCHLNK